MKEPLPADDVLRRFLITIYNDREEAVAGVVINTNHDLGQYNVIGDPEVANLAAKLVKAWLPQQ
jgi:hypothetical protein